MGTVQICAQTCKKWTKSNDNRESWWVEGKKKGGGERARKATNRRKFRALERLTTVESTDVGSSFLVALTSVACHWNHETSPHLYDLPSDYVATLSPLLSHCRCARGSAGRAAIRNVVKQGRSEREKRERERERDKGKETRKNWKTVSSVDRLFPNRCIKRREWLIRPTDERGWMNKGAQEEEEERQKTGIVLSSRSSEMEDPKNRRKEGRKEKINDERSRIKMRSRMRRESFQRETLDRLTTIESACLWLAHGVHRSWLSLLLWNKYWKNTHLKTAG